MTTNNHLSKYSNDYTDTQLNDIQSAATHSLQSVIARQPQILSYGDYSTKDRHLDWWKLVQNKISFPIAMSKKTVRTDNFDEYTFTTTDENLHFISGHILGKFDNTVKLPYFDATKTSNVMSDLLGASIVNALKGKFDMAYAYMRTTQLFISLAVEESTEYTETKPITTQLKAYEL